MVEQLVNSSANVQIVVSLDDLRQVFKEMTSEMCQKPKEKGNELMTVDEVTQMLHINRVTVWRWERDGYLKPKKIGRKKYYRQSDIERLAEQDK